MATGVETAGKFTAQVAWSGFDVVVVAEERFVCFVDKRSYEVTATF